ncbi:fasciclin domain-containing protein [Novilysobacter spongiicola]|uniref:Uncaracterized surface protein containing fasciclin (FAS1) repeats n=1 Tax=Lysobacter spongiicola DSM 21749 TaxID=1122188 RepID=A0A1T4N2K9_9GAMM|nr:fasciclin domain-containing protein [Lysobacter spongiicola]SJZ73267.1 Uncaracterized surface protein containing fasciclin (FAS1) repeats [Lysobacter spongiicola DSM 21749]
MTRSATTRKASPLRMLTAALALGLMAPVAVAGNHGGGHAKADQAKGDIVDTAVAAGKFNTLAAALTAAGLVDTLKGDGPFTVFAPTDEAFAALPAGTVDNLLKPENKDQLVAILTYHVVSGRYPAGRVAGLDEAATVNGESVDISANDSGVMVDGANVVMADVTATNGVIHVIDKVLMPDG